MTVLSEVLMEQMKKELETKIDNREVTFSDLQKVIPDLKMSFSRNRRIDGRMGCGAGYNVCLQRNNVKYYTEYNASITEGNHKPKKMDILYCINSDANCYSCTQNFSDFCSEFGYDEYEDRARARAYKAYKSCQKALEKMFELFTPEELEIIDKIFENY